MDTRADFFEQQTRLAFIASFARKRIPRRFEKAFDRLRFTGFQRALARSVLQIECTARPLPVRVFEGNLALIAAIKSIVRGTRPQNFTVGPFQIGIVPSLKWTHTPITPKHYLRRLLSLVTTEGSARLFRIAARKSGVRTGNRNQLRKFVESYNGRIRNIDGALSYDDMIHILTERHRTGHEKTALTSHQLLEISTRFAGRLDRIRKLIVDGTQLEAALLLTDLSQKMVLRAEYFGKGTGPAPALNIPRPVGSTLKVALYSALLEKRGVSLSTSIPDDPMMVEWRGHKIHPRNSDRQFRGQVTLEYAFANSINIPAVRIAQDLGSREIALFLQRCGIYRPMPETPLIALGGVELNALELLSTLTPILTGGFLCWPRANGAACSGSPPFNDGERILSYETAEGMRRLLRASANYGTARFLTQTGNPGWGGKTGTSEGNRDFWFIGAADGDICGAVWLGFADGRSMRCVDGSDASASRFAVPLWSEILAVYCGRCNRV